MGMTTMGVKLDDATRERIKTAATRIDRTPHWLIKQAIFNYLERLESEEGLPELPALLAGAANESEEAATAVEENHQPFLEFAEQILPQSVSRAAITGAYRRAETDAVPMLLEQARLPEAVAAQAHSLAYQLADKLRNQKTASGRAGMVQGLLQEFSLSSQEGVALMCLAEALLRIPDKATRDALIRDKISNGNWHSHIGRSPSLFVNAATWGLLFTGKLVCADCGHPLIATRETQRRKNGTSKRYVSYICSHFATTGHSACSWHRIYEISLKTLVLNEIRAHSQAVAQDENAVLDKLKQQILSESAAKQEDSKLEISRLRRRIGELEHMTAKLYEDKVSGTINSDTFAILSQKSEQERIQKAIRLEALLAEERKARQEVENIRQWAGIIRRYLDVQGLDREIVEELIDHIEIGERSVIDGQRHQDIKIFYRFVGVV